MFKTTRKHSALLLLLLPALFSLPFASLAWAQESGPTYPPKAQAPEPIPVPELPAAPAAPQALALVPPPAQATPTPSLLPGRNKLTVSSALDEAIKRSDYGILQKMRVRIMLAIRPEIRESVEQAVIEHSNKNFNTSLSSAQALLTPEQWDKIIDYILTELMPVLLDLLIKLIGGM